MPMIFRKHLNKYAPVLASFLLAFAAQADAASSTQAPSGAIRHAAASPADTGGFDSLPQWEDISGFIDRMVAEHGFARTDLEAIFRQVRYVDRAVQLIKPAPSGQRKNWQAYRSRFVEPVRIDAGAAFWNAHADALTRAERQYGVPAEIIVGILGVETIYGRNTGNFRVLDALTTLAFDYPDTPTRDARMDFFRSELESTLLFARDSGIDPLSLFGSYAGAIGLPQFMPDSIREFAVDFDGDGRIDLRNSPADAIGSVANFLARHGWVRGEPIVFPVTVSENENERGWEMFIGQGLEARFKLDELKAAGVKPTVAPPADMLYGLVDLQNGDEPTEYWLGARNFFAITRYNRSYFYAMSVVDLGRAVRVARDSAAAGL